MWQQVIDSVSFLGALAGFLVGLRQIWTFLPERYRRAFWGWILWRFFAALPATAPIAHLALLSGPSDSVLAICVSIFVVLVQFALVFVLGDLLAAPCTPASVRAAVCWAVLCHAPAIGLFCLVSFGSWGPLVQGERAGLASILYAGGLFMAMLPSVVSSSVGDLHFPR